MFLSFYPGLLSYARNLQNKNVPIDNASILRTALGGDRNKNSSPVNAVDSPRLFLFLLATVVQIWRSTYCNVLK